MTKDNVQTRDSLGKIKCVLIDVKVRCQTILYNVVYPKRLVLK